MIDVAFAIPELGHGGPDAVFRTLLRHLDRERFSPSVIIREGGATVDVDGSVVDEVATSRYPVFSTRQVLRRRQPDIVLSTLRMNVACAAARPLREGGPAHVVRITNNLTRKMREHSGQMTRAKLIAVEGSLSFAVARSDTVVAQTDVMREDLARRYGVAARRKTTVIHNPVDVDRLATLAAAEGPAFEHDGPTLVSVGRLAAQKGYDLLLSATRDVVDEHPDAHLVLIGQGPDRRALLERARRLGLVDHLTFLGQVGNPFPVVAKADVFVSSSRYEGFSNALAEAQALGVPAVAVGGDATGDIIVTSDTGVVVPSPEPTTMATAIVEILDDPGRFDPSAITESIRARFSAEKITADYQDMLEETLEGRSAPARTPATNGDAAPSRPRIGPVAAPIHRPNADGAAPSFVCIGAMKAGTTSLWEYLRAHPDISLPRSKEVDYFVGERSPTLRDYSRRFRDCDPDLLVGDVSPRYSLVDSHTVARGMASVVPEARLVYVVREPAERMRSHFRHEVLRAREAREARDAVDDDLYLDPSLYGAHLAAYLDHFSGDQVLLVDSESMRVNPEEVLSEVFTFIGADPAIAVDGPGEVYTAESRAAQSAIAEKLRTSRVGRLALSRMTSEAKLKLSEAYRTLQSPDTDRRARLLMASAVSWVPNESTASALEADGDQLCSLLPRLAGFVGGDESTIKGWREQWGPVVVPAPRIADDDDHH